ncbi:SPFH domain-containing protein [Kitasatospora paracochleata]|uniref:Regulator of protease activity HflC (Stomatin/prohibitin superfamily) n=1 Tax=Kitasatospora paracochleata TaxID=58354 RepID=A0ABT1J7A5_9ACTN|nr:SPFH domain-containing protein [Kitasatospora paracochleata]MCP2313003.1 regulator of protease activity HflC (stomatin/prohibitin superfamily) [Kitasatospora paracochleata]
MDVTRDSSPLPTAWPPAVPDLPAGATQLTRAVARAVTKPLIRAVPAEDEVETDPPTRPLPRVLTDPPSQSHPHQPPTGSSPAAALADTVELSAVPASAHGITRTPANSTAHTTALSPSTTADAPAVRRPPRADQSLREQRAFALPGWIPLLAILLGVIGAVLVLARTGVVPRLAALPDIRSAAVRATGGPVVTGQEIAAAAGAGVLLLLALSGLLPNPGGQTRVLTRWGRYRGTVRRTGLVWVNPLMRRRRVDVRLRHWRSEPVHVTDRTGTPLVVRLLIVWRVKDTARAILGIADHETYLREQTQAVLTRIASTLPCDSNAEPGAAQPGSTQPGSAQPGSAQPGPALRDGQWFADELTRALAAETAPAGLEVYSVQPLALDYAPEVSESMRRRRLADLDAGLRTVLVDDAVEAAALAVRRLERATAQQLDEAARSALMEQLLVAFVTPAGVTAAVSVPAARPVRRDGRST